MTPPGRTASNGPQVKEIRMCPCQVRGINLWIYASVKSIELDLSLTVEM